MIIIEWFYSPISVHGVVQGVQCKPGPYSEEFQSEIQQRKPTMGEEWSGDRGEKGRLCDQISFGSGPCQTSGISEKVSWDELG